MLYLLINYNGIFDKFKVKSIVCENNSTSIPNPLDNNSAAHRERRRRNLHRKKSKAKDQRERYMQKNKKSKLNLRRRTEKNSK